MTKAELIQQLLALPDLYCRDADIVQNSAVDLLVEYINDVEVSKAIQDMNAAIFVDDEDELQELLDLEDDDSDLDENDL